MGYSSKIYFAHHVAKDKTVGMFIQVIVDRKKKLFPIDMRWDHSKIDKLRGVLKPRKKNDPDVDDYNVILIENLARANEIFKKYRLSGQPMTMSKFEHEWVKGDSADSFIEYYRDKVKERLRNKEIAVSTYDDHLKTLKKVEAFNPDLSFADFDENWASDFNGFLARSIGSYRGDSTNTRWAHHKNVKCYMNLARKKDKIRFEYPYEFFTISRVESSWKAMHEREFIKLDHHYHEVDNLRDKRILRRFLFACTTGLRKSDLYRTHADWLNDGMLKFMPWKTRRTQKRLELPLSQLALGYFHDAIADKNGGLLFDDYEEQFSNRRLKAIADKIGIKTNLHHHVGRHTFITLFLKNGGDLHMAKELAGHSDIKTTILYDHIDEERKKDQIKHIDKITAYLEVG